MRLNISFICCLIHFFLYFLDLNYILVPNSGTLSSPLSHLIFLSLLLSSLEIRILASPKARPILLNSAVRKGERVVPPSALELLMRFTFPAPSARLKVGIFWSICYIFPIWCVFFFEKKCTCNLSFA